MKKYLKFIDWWQTSENIEKSQEAADIIQV